MKFNYWRRDDDGVGGLDEHGLIFKFFKIKFNKNFYLPTYHIFPSLVRAVVIYRTFQLLSFDIARLPDWRLQFRTGQTSNIIRHFSLSINHRETAVKDYKYCCKSSPDSKLAQPWNKIILLLAPLRIMKSDFQSISSLAVGSTS